MLDIVELLKSRGLRNYYDLEKEPGYEDLEDRVVIEWGASTRSWHQWLSPREVVEVLPKGYVDEFPGYLDFLITCDELISIVNNRSANRQWHTVIQEETRQSGIWAKLQLGLLPRSIQKRRRALY